MVVYGVIALKLFVGLVALLIAMRLLGKKEMSQITPFDFVYTIMLGGILEQGVYDEKVTILQIVFAIAIWVGLVYIIEVLVEKIDILKRPLKGEPATLIADGVINLKAMKKNNIEMEQLRSMLREKGVFSLKDASYVLLETSGAISILQTIESSPVTTGLLNMKSEQPKPSVMLIDEGKINETGLQQVGKTKDWLLSELQQSGFSAAREIYYAEWSQQSGFFFKAYEKNKNSPKY
jgi:uncharacterized membrane protein YcaP (DUF421 family)